MAIKSPVWTGPTLQGLVHWVGYRQSYYRHYPLTEGALVGEACGLISSALNEGEKLYCEVGYRRLLDPESTSKLRTTMKRADLVVVSSSEQRINDRSFWKNVKAVIEVKRSQSGKALIDDDLVCLREIRRYGVVFARAFLLVVSQSKRPKRFVKPDGTSIRKVSDAPKEAGICEVRRVCKAATSFEGRESAHYACLVEVEKPSVEPQFK